MLTLDLVGSAIYTPAIPYIEHIYHTIPVVASLGLALYVLGYGIGPLLFSPLSEIPVIGRNPPYMVGNIQSNDPFDLDIFTKSIY